MFDTISRDKRENLLSPRSDIPCVGHYTPSFKFLERSSPIIDFGQKSISRSLAFEDSKQISQLHSQNFNNKNGAAVDNPFKDSSLGAINLSPRAPQIGLEVDKLENSSTSKSRTMGESSSLPDIHDPIKRKLPNIFFNKQSERKSLLVSSVNPHEQRFENIDKFPKILTNNTSIVRSVEFGKFTKRKEIFSQSVCQNEYNADNQKFKYPKTIQCVLLPLKR